MTDVRSDPMAAGRYDDDDPASGTGRRRCPMGGGGSGAHAMLVVVIAFGASSSIAFHLALTGATLGGIVTPYRGAAPTTNETYETRRRRRDGSGMHVCTCLDDDDVPIAPRRLRWLHVPKTGTSFVTTLWSHMTSNRDRYIDLNVDSHQCDNYANRTYSMYDFVLMRRYPWEIYGAPNMITTTNVANNDSSSYPEIIDGRAVPLGLVGGTQHTPLSSLGDRRGSEVFDHNFTVVSFFRDPEERIVSAYYDSRHANGFSGDLFKQLLVASTKRKKEHVCAIPSGKGGAIETYRNPLECFARFPGISGCASRMLTGGTCADGLTRGDGTTNVRDAIDVVSNHLDWVGITEEWDESVCHFHRLYGRTTDVVDDMGRTMRRRRVHPLQGEFGNVHKSNKTRVYDVKDLNGFVDVADTLVYDAARIKFDEMVRAGGGRCHRYMTWDELDAASQGPAADDDDDDDDDDGDARRLPYLERDEDGRVCEPLSCSDLGKQCGEWDDGCGRTVICGLCDPARTGLPSTWRVKCVEGMCVDYCPPWDESGLWFTNDMADDVRLIGGTMWMSNTREYLSPVDAVAICQMACDDKKRRRHGGIEAFVNEGLCRCGRTSKILSMNLTSLDFTRAHDMKTACYANRARRDGWLRSYETQPVCCKYIDQQTKPPVGWKRMTTIGAFNVEGEYFDRIRLECGAFKECELSGRVRGAEVAVFDLYHNMCYLIRNVFDLKDVYTVTKDNHMRYTIDLRWSSVYT